MASEWRLRPMEPADVPAVLAIQRASLEAACWAARSYEQACANTGIFARVAEGKAGLAGFLVARVTLGEMEILNMAVLPASRRSGAGTLLLSDALKFGQACKATRVFLEVRASNTGALAFYTRHNFALVGRRPSYYGDPIEDALVLGWQPAETSF